MQKPALKFSEDISFPLSPKYVHTKDGVIPFIYDQYSLYKEFSAQNIQKSKNEVFIIKTHQLETLSLTGRANKVCGYANPAVQFDSAVPWAVKNNIKNTILFNADQESCPQDFSFVIAHEVSHLFIQDDPPHSLVDDLDLQFNIDSNNLLNMAGGTTLSRKYQCPKIKSTILDLTGAKNE